MSNAASGKLPRLIYPLVVEGRYDKSAILGMFSGVVITTEGFGVFNNKEKRALIKRLCVDRIILLTDSDGGGRQIRSFLTGILPKEKIINLYVPEIKGKERRKTKASRSGLLGVEGVGAEVLRKLLSPYTDGAEAVSVGGIESADFYRDGLMGKECSSILRDRLCAAVGLPSGMNAKSLLSAINLLINREEYLRLCRELSL